MLTSSLTLLGPIVLCLVVYVRWQLGDVDSIDAGLVPLPSVSTPPALAPNGCSVEPGAAVSERACAAGVAPREGAQRPGRWRAPGVYFDAGRRSADSNADASIRGQLLADRIIHGRFDADRRLRRGSKGALDVIVVGANLLGISATLRLMQAGLRVLLVDRQSWAPLDASGHRLLASRPGLGRRARLPLVTGHHVTVVARRADGMLEVQAERAAWYTANVIFASALPAPAVERGDDLALRAPDASPRAA